MNRAEQLAAVALAPWRAPDPIPADDVPIVWLLVLRQLRGRPHAAADVARLMGSGCRRVAEMPALLAELIDRHGLDL